MRFGCWVRLIVSQQISTKAAASIGGRLLEWCGGRDFKAEKIAEATEEDLRGCGLSRSKQCSMRSLAETFLANKALVRKLAELTEEEISDFLLPIHGIGPWTLQMFYIFCLGRLDVWPIADLGVRTGVRELLQLSEPVTSAELIRIAEPWRPYRSVASWYLWRSRGPVPQSR